MPQNTCYFNVQLPPPSNEADYEAKVNHLHMHCRAHHFFLSFAEPPQSSLSCPMTSSHHSSLTSVCPVYTYNCIVEIILPGMKMHEREIHLYWRLKNNTNSHARSHIQWLIHYGSREEILRWNTRRVYSHQIKYNNNEHSMLVYTT